MIHYSCDRCKRSIEPDEELRYSVSIKIEIALAAEDHLRDLTAKIGPRATSQVLHGNPLTVLTRLGRSPTVDLIALGPSRATLIQRAFIGSVSRRVLRDATCDVLICGPDARGRTT